MSHRKFYAPRHGSLRFLPKARCTKGRGRIRSYPPDDKGKEPHLTAFMGYKAGMTHVMRQLDRPMSAAHEKDIVEGVTIIETPPIVIVGMVGYVRTPSGLKSVTTVWCSHVDDTFKRRYYKNWTRSKRKAFSKWQSKFSASGKGGDPAEYTRRIEYIKRYADVVRVIAHSQVKRLKHLGRKKAHVCEIQINGGTIEQKVAYATKMFEKHVAVKDVFSQNELIDTISITKGHGWKGVVSRWGVTRLPRKTHRGLRKVACIGAWHPARVGYQVARGGQKGYFHRTEIHKKIYRIGDKIQFDKQGKPTAFNGQTKNDLTEKNITPMGGFVRYGVVKQDFIMIKGTCPGVRKRAITLRKSLVAPSGRGSGEEIDLKFIDTSSQYGNGRFQTSKEKHDFFGPLKREKLEESKRKAAERKLRREKGLPEENEGKEAPSKRKGKGSKRKRKGSKRKGKGSKRKAATKGKAAKTKTQRKA